DLFGDAMQSETARAARGKALRQIGAIPRAALPLKPQHHFYAESRGFGIATLVALVAAIALAIRRRAWDVVRLGVLSLALVVMAAWSVSRIVGTFEAYLVTWISAVGFAAWVTVGAALFAPAHPRRAVGTRREQ